jgi:receptor protein-tyrosine kinase
MTRAHLVERLAERLGGLAGAPRALVAAPTIAPAVDPAQPVIAIDILITAGLQISPDGRLRSRILEELTIVQHQLLRSIAQATQPASARSGIVVVTSALPGEGKSFISLNLAAGLASRSGRQVILVDADGRRGGLSHALGIADAPGLRHLAADPLRAPAPLLRGTALARLRVLGFGASLAEPRDTPAGGTMGAALLRLAAACPDALVLIDTPPCLSTSDASALAAVAGQVVVVVDSARTQRNEVEATLDMLEACPVLQLLLNRVRFTANDTFGAHGDYGAPDAA